MRTYLPAALALFFLAAASGAAAVQDPVSAPSDLDQLEKAVYLLENPEEAKKLAERLRPLIEAQKKLDAARKKPLVSVDLTGNLVHLYRDHRAKAQMVLYSVRSELRDLPRAFERLTTYLSIPENRQKALSLWINLGVAFLAGLAVWLFFRRLTRRMQKKMTWEQPLSVSGKTVRALTEAAFKACFWVGLLLFAYLFVHFVAIGQKLRVILLGELIALTVYFSAKNLVYALICPESRELRVFPVEDRTAGVIFVWSRRLLLFSLWMYLLIIPSRVLEQKMLASVFSGFHKAGLALMLMIVLARWKELVYRVVCLVPRTDESAFRRRLKTACNVVVGKFYLAVVIYLGLMTILPTLGLPDVHAYLVSATIRSIVVILAAAGLYMIWKLLIEKLFALSASLKKRYPGFEEHADRYMSFIRGIGHWAIIALAAMSILDVWGLAVFEFLGANTALVQPLIHIPLIVLFGIFLFHMKDLFIGWLERRMSTQMEAGGKVSRIEMEKRISTLGWILRKTIVVTILIVVSMMVLSELGFNIVPILTGAGILGLAVGFGSQNLVRDIISGLFLIIENRIRVGDVAIINGTGGLVEQVNPRTTVLRSQDGTIHVFPNGTIETLSNMTYGFSFYVFDVGVAYKEDVDRVMEVLRQIGAEVMEDEELGQLILEPLEILGVDKLADSAVVIKARIKTVPIKQWLVGREMNRRIKKRFDAENIEIPFPHRTIYFGEAGKPSELLLSGLKENREELKRIVREVLSESRAQSFVDRKSSEL